MNVVGLYFDTSQNVLYSANGSSNTISKITASGTQTTYFSGLSGPRNLVMDNRGYLYVSNTNANNIIEIAPNGSTSRIFLAGLNNPRGIVIGPDGFFYLSNSSAGTVLRIDTSGVATTLVSGLSLPDGLAFDSSGNLYIVERGNSIVKKRDHLGNLMDFATVNSAQGIAVSVPEPSGTTLAISGVSMILVVLAKRHLLRRRMFSDVKLSIEHIPRVRSDSCKSGSENRAVRFRRQKQLVAPNRFIFRNREARCSGHEGSEITPARR